MSVMGRLLVVKTRRTLVRRGRGRRSRVLRFWGRETHVTGTHVASANQQVHQHAVGSTLFGRLLLFAPFPRRGSRIRVRSHSLHAAVCPAGVLCVVCARGGKKGKNNRIRKLIHMPSKVTTGQLSTIFLTCTLGGTAVVPLVQHFADRPPRVSAANHQTAATVEMLLLPGPGRVRLSLQ